MDYISLHSDEFAVAFCQATAPLCPDVQRLIWQEVISPPNFAPPPAPKNVRNIQEHVQFLYPEICSETRVPSN